MAEADTLDLSSILSLWKSVAALHCNLYSDIQYSSSHSLICSIHLLLALWQQHEPITMFKSMVCPSPPFIFLWYGSLLTKAYKRL